MNIFFRWATALIFGGIIAYVIWTKDDVDRESDRPLQRKYGSIIYPGLLMSFFLFLFIAASIETNARFSFDNLFPLLCGIFISIAIFFVLFMLLLPILRKYVSAKAIALIWLLPNYLYITVQTYMALDKPRLVFDLGNISLRKVSLIWITVAVIVFAVYLIRHFVFRHRLLHNADAVEDESIRSLWEAMQTAYEFKRPCIKLAVSDKTSTPLSIGLFRHATVLVLPHTNYTEEELKLIFKHELIHIIRGDSGIKLFIAFCNAVCWFNPLMWIAMKKYTEDLELSCDEYVLEDCNKEEKDLYGNLILSAAGNEAGFTTCLSASAGALKYRLTNIYRPKRKFNGGIAVGVLMAVMLLTSGCIALSYNHQTVADVFSEHVNEVNIDKESISVAEGNEFRMYSCKDPDALNDYLMNLKICDVTGNYNNNYNDGKSLYCHYQTDEGMVVVCVDDNMVEYSPLYTAGRIDSHTYQLEDSIDWDYIMSTINVRP